MKRTFLAASIAFALISSANAQSTVDSIRAKYKLQQMPAARTLEQTFPVLGNYQLQSSTNGTGSIAITLDQANKGVIWVEGLPQGKFKAYLKQSPTTYRILSQKTESGKQLQEGTLHYDTASRNLHIALGKAYDDAAPLAVFETMPGMQDQMSGTETETKVKEGDTKIKTEREGNQVKTKTKTPAAKTKTKVEFYTAMKQMAEPVMQDTQMQDAQMKATDSTNQQLPDYTQQQKPDSSSHQ